MIDEPHFMTNREWYFYDGKKYQLTEKAPPKAVQSYKDFYKEIEDSQKNHIMI